MNKTQIPQKIKICKPPLIVVLIWIAVTIFACEKNPLFNNIKLAEELRNKGMSLKAIELYQQLIDSYPKKPIAITALYEQANTYYLYLNNYKKAINHFSQLIHTHPKSDLAIYSQKNISDIYMLKIKDYKQAIIEFSELLEIKDLTTVTKEEIMYNISCCYLKLNNYQQARLELFNLLNKFPNSSFTNKYYLKIATTLYLNRELKKAIKIYQELIKKIPPQNILNKAKFNMAGIYEEINELHNALLIYQELLENYPNKKSLQQRINRVRARLEVKEN